MNEKISLGAAMPYPSAAVFVFVAERAWREGRGMKDRKGKELGRGE
jgi:hypothetical protein